LTDTTHKKQRTRWLYPKAASLYWRDQLTISLVSGLEAEAQARELGDQKLLANILYYLGGCIYRELGEYDKAVSCLEEGISLCRLHHLHSRLSLALSSYAAILFHQRKKEEAQSMVDEALQIAVRENDLWGQGYAFRVHADFLIGEHKFSESMELYERAFNIAQSIDDRISMGMELANLSLLANMLEDFQASGQHAEAALSIFQAIGNDYQQPFPQRMIAYCALHENNLPRARSFCVESLRGNHKLGHTTGVLACLLALAAIEMAAGNEPQAASLFGYVRTQLEQQSLQLMEPDRAVLQKLEKGFAGKVDIPIPELSIPDLIRDLNLGN